MTKQTIDHTSVLEMALVGYEIQKGRIEAAIAEIQAQLGGGVSSRPTSTATDNSKPKVTGKKRFSAAARRRMAAAQKKRWQLLKVKKAQPRRTQPTAPGKRRKATVAPVARNTPVQVKLPKARKTAVTVQKAVAKPEVNPVPPVQTAELTPAETTA